MDVIYIVTNLLVIVFSLISCATLFEKITPSIINALFGIIQISEFGFKMFLTEKSLSPKPSYISLGG